MRVAGLGVSKEKTTGADPQLQIMWAASAVPDPFILSGAELPPGS